MSDFLMIIPPGWSEVPEAESVMSDVSWNGASIWEVTEALKSIGMIVENGGIAALEYRVFRDAGVLRVWALLGTEQ